LELLGDLDHGQPGLWTQALQTPEQLASVDAVLGPGKSLPQGQGQEPPVGVLHEGPDTLRDSRQKGLCAPPASLARSAERFYKAQNLFRGRKAKRHGDRHDLQVIPAGDDRAQLELGHERRVNAGLFPELLLALSRDRA
jgi:hypothetical protein